MENEISYKNSIYTIIHQILTDLSEKINSITSAIKDISNQISFLNNFVANPSHQSVIDKIHDLEKSINTVVENKVVRTIDDDCRNLNEALKRINDDLDNYDKEHSLIRIEIQNINSLSKQISENLKEINNIKQSISDLDEKIDLIRKIVLWFLFTGVPSIFGIALFIQKHVMK